MGDFTGQRGGVYFEAGFAMGLGLPVIWLVRKDEVEKLHFDTRQYAHIAYESAEDLKQKLHKVNCRAPDRIVSHLRSPLYANDLTVWFFPIRHYMEIYMLKKIAFFILLAPVLMGASCNAKLRQEMPEPHLIMCPNGMIFFYPDSEEFR